MSRDAKPLAPEAHYSLAEQQQELGPWHNQLFMLHQAKDAIGEGLAASVKEAVEHPAPALGKILFSAAIGHSLGLAAELPGLWGRVGRAAGIAGATSFAFDLAQPLLQSTSTAFTATSVSELDEAGKSLGNQMGAFLFDLLLQAPAALSGDQLSKSWHVQPLIGSHVPKLQWLEEGETIRAQPVHFRLLDGTEPEHTKFDYGLDLESDMVPSGVRNLVAHGKLNTLTTQAHGMPSQNLPHIGEVVATTRTDLDALGALAVIANRLENKTVVPEIPKLIVSNDVSGSTPEMAALYQSARQTAQSTELSLPEKVSALQSIIAGQLPKEPLRIAFLNENGSSSSALSGSSSRLRVDYGVGLPGDLLPQGAPNIVPSKRHKSLAESAYLLPKANLPKPGMVLAAPSDDLDVLSAVAVLSNRAEEIKFPNEVIKLIASRNAPIAGPKKFVSLFKAAAQTARSNELSPIEKVEHLKLILSRSYPQRTIDHLASEYDSNPPQKAPEHQGLDKPLQVPNRAIPSGQPMNQFETLTGTIGRIYQPFVGEHGPHQRFQMRLDDGRKVTIHNNISNGNEIPLQSGEKIVVHGALAGKNRTVMHWTHSDWAKDKPAGWIDYQGLRYQ